MVNPFLLCRGHLTGLLRQWRTRSTQTTTREKTMNTIQITNDEGQVVNYTEEEVKRAFNDAKFSADQLTLLQDQRVKLKRLVRDFFSELGWESGYDGGEATIHKDHVNELLKDLGVDGLTSTFRGAATINFVFEVEAVDEDEARSIIEENASVQEYGFESSDESVSVDEIDENY
jgi:hypothetical protein